MDIFLDPNVAYFLLVVGFLLAILAVLTPGTGILEVGALFALGLAGWAVYNLPVNLWALGVLTLGVFPFLVAVRRSGQLMYLAVSIAALVLGSVFLFRGPDWRPVVNPILAIFVSVASAGFLWLLASKTLEASAVRPVHDLERLVGTLGETTTEVHEEGSVFAGGELWSARSSEPIPPEAPVWVVGRDGFILRVEAVETSNDNESAAM